MVDLLPCPFCGWADMRNGGLCHAVMSDDNPSEVIGPSGVCCPNCAAYVVGGMDDDAAVEAWNRRAHPNPTPGGVTALNTSPEPVKVSANIEHIAGGVTEALDSCAALLETMAEYAEKRGDVAEWSMMHVMAAQARDALSLAASPSVNEGRT